VANTFLTPDGFSGSREIPIPPWNTKPADRQKSILFRASHSDEETGKSYFGFLLDPL
jgi:hypothetical protein